MVVDSPAPASAFTTSVRPPNPAASTLGVRYLRWLGIPAVVERDGEREVNLQGAVIRDGRPVRTDARRYLVSFPAALKKTKIRIAWGIADRQTALSMAGPLWRETPQGGVFDSKWRLKFVGLPAKAGGELQVSYLCGRRDPLGSHRLLAIDHQGREHSPLVGTGTGTGGGSEQDLVFVDQFHGLEMGDVKEFRLQTRPHQWGEFSDVALTPKASLPRRAALELAEPLLRTVDELIDFDTGRLAVFPAQKRGHGSLTGLGDNLLWAQENGFDAVASTGKLDILDADFAPLSSADWERLTPQEVINRLHRGTFHPRTLKELRSGEFPATYAYRTREQGYGMIQLVAFDPRRPGATVRLKRVARPGSPALRPPSGSGCILQVTDVACWIEGDKFAIRVDYEASGTDGGEVFARSENLPEPAIAEFFERVGGRSVKRHRRVWQLELVERPGMGLAVPGAELRTDAGRESLRAQVAAEWLNRALLAKLAGRR